MSTLEGLTLNPGLPTPLYHQLYTVLRERIMRGDFAPSQTLPGEQELARMFDVSRITVKRALNELAASGLVSRHRGRGTIVTDRGVVPVVQGSFETLINSLHAIGMETEVRLLEVVEGRMPDSVIARLELAADALVQCSTRVRSVEGAPFSHLVSYVPAEIARRYDVKDLASTAILTLLSRVGAEAYEANQWITATGAEPQIASALDVPVGAPLLQIERVMKGRDGRPVQFMVAHYRPDRFQYTVHAKRRGGARAGAWRDESW